MELKHEAVQPIRPFEEVYTQRLEVVEQAVEARAAELRGRAEPYGPYVSETTESCVSLLERGGKRMRGVLVMTGYEMFGGTNIEAAARAAAVVEIDHAWFLIMDDIADAADTRRGDDTAHVRLRRSLDARTFGGRAQKIGEDLANIGAADMHTVGAIALLRLGLEHEISPDAVLRAAVSWNDCLSLTAKGQILDIYGSIRPDMTDEEIKQVALIKTAYYSCLGPIELGMRLAGASEEEIALFRPYAEQAGLAFQMQDDIIGIYGDPAKTGKSTMSDIKEGKQTVLMRTALAATEGEAHQLLASSLGDPMLDGERFVECLRIMKDCGAYDHVRGLAAQYADNAAQAIAAVPGLAAQDVFFLQEMAYYGVNRSA